MTSSTSLSDRLTWAVLILVLLGAGVAWAWRAVLFVPEPEPAAAIAAPVAFPEFTLTERSGRSVSRAELLGRPWVADFVFTSCAGPCPIMSSRMGELQRAFVDCPLRFVSFTLDPQRDTLHLRHHLKRGPTGDLKKLTQRAPPSINSGVG